MVDVELVGISSLYVTDDDVAVHLEHLGVVERRHRHVDHAEACFGLRQAILWTQQNRVYQRLGGSGILSLVGGHKHLAGLAARAALRQRLGLGTVAGGHKQGGHEQ